MKKYNEAIATYNKKVELGKANINDYLGLTRAYYSSKDYVKADSAASQMIRLKPDLQYGYFWRARANAVQDPNVEGLAKPYYELFISKIKPEEIEKNKKDLSEAYTYLAVYYSKKKDCENSTLYFKKVLEVDPTNAQAKNFLAKPC